MIVDSSALVAALLDEPDAPRYRRAIATAPTCLMSAATLVEVGIVLRSRLGIDPEEIRVRVVERNGIEVRPLDAETAMVALQGFATFGKGRHPAALNFCDCFSYALAKVTGLPLLYKGRDFSQTDIMTASLPVL